MSNDLIISQTAALAEKLKIPAADPNSLVQVLKATAFKGNVTDAQMTALLGVASQYGLNPFTKEIYAFPDRQNGIVPVVGVDGWSRIINQHAQFDGIEFAQDAESCTCIIYRKDRSHPTRVTEYLDECRRDTGPWKSHPRRMLRHKATIQCARLAFGYTGIYDMDEAERIMEAQPAVKHMGPVEEVRPAKPPYPEDKFAANLPTWRKAIEAGRKSAEDVIATVESKHALTDAQKAAIRAPIAPAAAPATVIDAGTGEVLQAPAPQPAAPQHTAETLDFVRDMEGAQA